ncbi:MAG TPA: hypothetical protein VGM84_15580 [Steroidobacteraceae bacterium]|jgi:hypothetical protein
MSFDGKWLASSGVTNLPRQYRERAEGARAKAETAADEETRKKYLQIADTWERMAQYEQRSNLQAHLWRKPKEV